MKNLEITPALKQARSQFETKRAEHARIAGAIQQARTALREAEATLEGAHANLAGAEAGAVLGDGTLTGSSRKGFLSARDAVDFAKARIRGLEGSLMIAADAVRTAGQTLTSAFAEWQRGLESDLAAEYATVLKQFMDVVDRGLAMASSLNSGRLTLALRKVVAPGDIHGSKPLIQRQGLWRTTYQSSPAHMELSTKLGAIRREMIGDIAEVPEVRAEAVVPQADNFGSQPLRSRAGMRVG